MHYDALKDLSPAKFRRLTGVTPDTFEVMLSVITAAWRDFGRPPKLSRQDQLLLALSYWREYRSLAHIAITYNVSEPTVWRTVRRVEDTLIKSGRFCLPGRKALVDSNILWQVVAVDTTETAIERPKKSNVSSTLARKSVIPSKHR